MTIYMLQNYHLDGLWSAFYLVLEFDLSEVLICDLLLRQQEQTMVIILIQLFFWHIMELRRCE